LTCSSGPIACSGISFGSAPIVRRARRGSRRSTDRRLVIIVALPGIAPDQLEIVVGDSALSVVGERAVHLPVDALIHRLEIPYGRFERRINLPQGRFEIEERALEHGCLRLVLRKI
jgi:HSP20 family molecular chaperone IbpA